MFLYNMNLINTIFEKSFNRNKNTNFLFDIHTHGMLDKIFSPDKVNLYHEKAAYNIKYTEQKLDGFKKLDKIAAVLHIAANQKINLLSSRVNFLENQLKSSKRFSAIYNVGLNTHRPRLENFNALTSISQVNNVSRISLHSFAPRKQKNFSLSSVTKAKSSIQNANYNYDTYVDRPSNSEQIKSQVYNKKHELWPADHFTNHQNLHKETMNYGKFSGYDMAIIEKYFFNMARRPPSGGTGFDPLITPVWAGVKLPG